MEIVSLTLVRVFCCVWLIPPLSVGCVSVWLLVALPHSQFANSIRK